MIILKEKNRAKEKNIKSKFLWARIGMRVECTPSEYSEFLRLLQVDKEKASNFAAELFIRKGEIHGDSYMPAEVDDNPNKEELDLQY